MNKRLVFFALLLLLSVNIAFTQIKIYPKLAISFSPVFILQEETFYANNTELDGSLVLGNKFGAEFGFTTGYNSCSNWNSSFERYKAFVYFMASTGIFIEIPKINTDIFVNYKIGRALYAFTSSYFLYQYVEPGFRNKFFKENKMQIALSFPIYFRADVKSLGAKLSYSYNF